MGVLPLMRKHGFDTTKGTTISAFCATKQCRASNQQMCAAQI